MGSPFRQGSRATKEDSAVVDVDNVSFSEPCAHCVTKKRHCLHGCCGQRKKIHLMAFPPTPHPPTTSLRRSLSFPVCNASPPEKNPTFLRTQSDLVSVGRVNDVLGSERQVMEAKDRKGDPTSPHVGTIPMATPSLDIRGKKKMHQRKVRPSRTRRRLLMQEVEKKEDGQNASPTEKNEEMQRTNLSLKKDENGKNDPVRLTPPAVSPSSETWKTPLPPVSMMSPADFLVETPPEDSTGISRIGDLHTGGEGTSSDEVDDSQPPASKPAISDTDGDDCQKGACVLLREIEGKLHRLGKMMEELTLRNDANVPTANRQPSCHHTKAMTPEAAGAPLRPPSAVVSSSSATSSGEAMFAENQEPKPSYHICPCSRCHKF